MLEFPESLSVVVLHCQSECVGYLPGLVEYQVTEPYWRVGALHYSLAGGLGALQTHDQVLHRY